MVITSDQRLHRVPLGVATARLTAHGIAFGCKRWGIDGDPTGATVTECYADCDSDTFWRAMAEVG